jgi:hypothetical protein
VTRCVLCGKRIWLDRTRFALTGEPVHRLCALLKQDEQERLIHDGLPGLDSARDHGERAS